MALQGFCAPHLQHIAEELARNGLRQPRARRQHGAPRHILQCQQRLAPRRVLCAVQYVMLFLWLQEVFEEVSMFVGASVEFGEQHNPVAMSSSPGSALSLTGALNTAQGAALTKTYVKRIA